MSILSTLRNSDRIYCYIRRHKYGLGELLKKEARLGRCNLTSEQKQLVRKAWPGFAISHATERFIGMYNQFRPKNAPWSPYYIPDTLSHIIIDPSYNDYLVSRITDDKNMYDLYFHGYNQPRTIVRKVNGILLDKDYNIIDMNFAEKFIRQVDGAVYKPSVITNSGEGIAVWRKDDPTDDFLELLKKSRNCIIQELVKQHVMMSHLHRGSVNTIRILTWAKKMKLLFSRLWYE